MKRLSTRSLAAAAAAVLVLLAGIYLALPRTAAKPAAERGPSAPAAAGKAAPKRAPASVKAEAAPRAAKPAAEAPEAPQAEEPAAESPTEEERREEAEEKLVEAFDALTDRWMETEGRKPATMDDVMKFNEAFRQVPAARRDECLHRALNLIPDENVMLLAGILLDKSYEKETLETVFNDVLNRDESVKMPILREVFKDKTHPCWADTAWIFDVTGELPGAKK